MNLTAQELKDAGLLDDMISTGSNCGFQDPRKMGLPFFGAKQLKAISDMMNKKANNLTAKQIEQAIITEYGNSL